MKERGIEVAAVRVWREVKAQAIEVARVAHELAGQVRDWIDRTMERAAPGHGLAYADGADRDGRKDLAARLREALEARQSRAEVVPAQIPEPERSLAERLREAAQGIDREGLAERAAGLQQDRQAEERQRVQEAERLKEQERVLQQEREAHQREQDRGIDYGV